MSDAFKMVFAEEIKEIEDRIAKKDEEITKKDEEIAKKDEEIAKKDEEIAKRDEGTIIQMLKDNVPASTICKWLSLPMEMIAYIAGKHGLKYRTIGK